MTERVYYTSDATDGRAQIIACTAEADGRYAIELDRTLFHPQGGGQPADRGWIAGQLVETVVVRGERVLHILSQPLPLGEVEMKIDASARQLHARLHSAGHLLGLAGEQLGWQPVKAHHWPGEGRITFASRNSAALPDASALLALVKAWQAQDLPRLAAIALAAFDYVMDMGTSRGDGTELFYARCAVLHAARVAGIAAYDVVWSDINNEEGFLAEANLAKNLGFNGKSLVNPRQIELLHQVYAPTRKEVDHALEVIAAAEEAETRGLGVVSLNGKMIDGPIIDHARKVVALSASGIRD